MAHAHVSTSERPKGPRAHSDGAPNAKWSPSCDQAGAFYVPLLLTSPQDWPGSCLDQKHFHFSPKTILCFFLTGLLTLSPHQRTGESYYLLILPKEVVVQVKGGVFPSL